MWGGHVKGWQMPRNLLHEDHSERFWKPLDGYGKGCQDAAGHAGVGERVDQVGEQDCEDAAVRLR